MLTSQKAAGLLRAIAEFRLDEIDGAAEKSLRAALMRLSFTERTTLILRFGLLGERPRTLQEVGDYFGGWSRQRAWLTEKRALRELAEKTRPEDFTGAYLAIFRNGPLAADANRSGRPRHRE